MSLYDNIKGGEKNMEKIIISSGITPAKLVHPLQSL